MKTLILGVSLACATCICFAQEEARLCPRHIETPDYPTIARVANLTGKVSLRLTIDAEGNVIDAQGRMESNIPHTPEEVKILEKIAVSNIRKWTFAKPPSAPYTETIVYDYEIDKTRRARGTQVTFDLPNNVTIVAEPPQFRP
jgi:TonB family protein